MVRRDVAAFERDQWVVKWTLVAAALALLVGYFAQSTLQRHAVNTATTAEQRVEVVPTSADQPPVQVTRTASVSVKS